MSLSRTLLSLIAQPLKWRRKEPSRPSPSDPRILVIRRNRMGDMIYTLPLLHALRRHFPQAQITVACDEPGIPIALACEAVNVVFLLEHKGNRWLAVWKSAAMLQDYDWVIAAKGGFDRRLAVLTRLTNAAIRIGFDRKADGSSAYFTDPVALPEQPNEEHQVDTLLRLLHPLGLVNPTGFSIDLSLQLPESSQQFARETLKKAPFDSSRRFMLINLSSTVPLKFREEDFLELISRIIGTTDLAVGLVAAPADQRRAFEMALCLASPRLISVPTESPLDLAALLERATVLFTPEGGAAHLAAVTGTPALVLWSEGPFHKWYSRAANHAYVQADPSERTVSIERVWRALHPFLETKA